MAMARSNSSGWRLLRPSYYLRRPRRLILLFASLLCFSLLIWDRRSLIQDHEIERAELENQKQQLSSQIETLRKMLRDYPKKDVQVSDDTKSSFMSKDTDLQDFSNDAQSEERRLKIKEAMLHAWRSYEKYAWGHDELQPLSKNGVDDFGGLGATIVDSLDTLYIMGLHDEFAKARDWVANSLDFNKNYDASVFETTIRVVGGLLSAYDLSGEKMFLEKVQQLADKLLPAWNSPSGIPYGSINLAYGNPRSPGWTGGSSVLADLATEQVEFIALSHRTGDPRYKEKVENVIKQIKKIFPKDGLVPIYISPESGEATTSKITFGAMGDSFYEYLLKVWILGNKTEAVREYREMWEQSMDGLMTLIKKSTPSSFSYIAERVGQNSYIDKMDELACFAPGMLVLGADGKDAEMNKKYLDLAKELGRTCYNFYNSTPTKLAGENYEFRTGQDMQVGVAWNILRPETVESLMYLWRKTGDAKYRDWGWDIFQAFESQSRTDSGYVGLRDVRTGEKDNKMQSFFLAETFKYLYLLFSPSNVIPLDQWVFNTEAHPIRITPMLSTEVKNNTGNSDARSRILDRLRHRKKLIGA